MSEDAPQKQSEFINEVPHDLAPVPVSAEAEELINTVPGFDRQVAEVAKEVVAGTHSGGKFSSGIVENIDFKGDPRRVLGHPSNPMTSMRNQHDLGAEGIPEASDSGYHEDLE